MKPAKPYVSIATFCERVLQETDGVVSVIRAVDIYQFEEPEKRDPEEKVSIKVTLFLALRSGPVTGDHDLQMKFRTSQGTVKDINKVRATFEGGAKSVHITANLSILTENVGLNWVEVYWYDELLTAIPVTLQRANSNSPSGQ